MLGKHIDYDAIDADDYDVTSTDSDDDDNVKSLQHVVTVVDCDSTNILVPRAISRTNYSNDRVSVPRGEVDRVAPSRLKDKRVQEP